MQTHVFKFTLLSAAVLALSLLASAQAFAQCCPGGGGIPKAKTGLGQSFPPAIDLAADPDWQVYEFERDGITYTQIDDRQGKVRAAVGRAGNAFWAMPIGGDVDRVSVSALPSTFGQRKVLYRSGEIEVILLRTAVGDYWLVHQPAARY